MPYLSPPTLTRAEQDALLSASSEHPRIPIVPRGDYLTAGGRDETPLRLGLSQTADLGENVLELLQLGLF